MNISIHAPANGATLYDVLIKIRPNISIHAPANGATCTHREPRSKNAISIHAPANGATAWTYTKDGKNTDFNPRSGERGDQHPMC